MDNLNTTPEQRAGLNRIAQRALDGRAERVPVAPYALRGLVGDAERAEAAEQALREARAEVGRLREALAEFVPEAQSGRLTDTERIAKARAALGRKESE